MDQNSPSTCDLQTSKTTRGKKNVPKKNKSSDFLSNSIDVWRVWWCQFQKLHHVALSTTSQKREKYQEVCSIFPAWEFTRDCRNSFCRKTCPRKVKYCVSNKSRRRYTKLKEKFDTESLVSCRLDSNPTREREPAGWPLERLRCSNSC